MTQSHAKARIEEKYGPVREGLLTRLNAGRSPKQIAREWGVHYNTILAWMDEEEIERFSVYRTREPETVGAAG